MPIRPALSLRGRLLLFLTAVFALFFAGLIHEHAAGQRHAHEKALARASDLARGYVHQYDRLLRERLTLLDILLRMPGFDPDDAARCGETLRHIVAADPSLVNLVLLDGQNRVRCAGRPGSITDAAAATARRAQENRGAMVGMSGTDGQARAYLALARTVMASDGTARGALLAFVDRDWLNERFAATVPAGVVLRILDGDGIFVVRQPDPACCVGKSGLRLGGIGEALASGREQVRKSLWLDGVERLQADLPLAAPLAGVLSIGIPEAQVLSDADRAAAHLGWLLAALCLALYGLSWLFSDRLILRPLRALSEGAQRLRQGELAFRIPDGVGTGEFALLRRDFNAMADTLDARRAEIGRDVERLVASEQALRESENRFRNLYEQAPLPHQSLDAGGTILDVNAAWCELFGRTREEALGRYIGEFMSEESCNLLGERFERFKAEGRTGGNVFEIVRADGAKRLVEVNGRIARDAGGNFLRTHCILSDLTERKEAEERLQANELRYRSMIENAPEGVWIIGADECTIEVNRHLCELIGCAPQEMAGRKPTDFTDPANGRIFERQKALRTTLHHRVYEIALRHRDGRNIPVNFSATNLYREDGSLHSVLAFVTDLTQRKRDEQILRESEARHRLIVDTALDAVVSMGSDGCVTEWNGEAERMFGYKREAALGRPIAELIVPPQLREAHKRGLQRFLETGRGKVLGTRIETTAMRASGGEFPVELAIATVGDGSGLFFSAFIRDITDRKRLEEEARRHREELELRVAERTQALQTANRELEAFSYSVSHDLRAPLRAINGFSHLLEEEFVDLLDDKGRHYLQRVRAGSERMGQLIDDLLKLSQMTRQPMKVVPTSLSDLAAEIAAELQAGEPERNVEWIVAPDVTAEGDAGLLRAVLLNLLANAWKYSSRREQARIEFGVCRKDGQPVYFVRDNGAGFDMAHASRLFGAFQRLHSSSEFPGSGIGLATVARIIHRHGGQVWAEGKVGEGATFHFTLNVQAPPAATL